MAKAQMLSAPADAAVNAVTFGVCSAADPRIPPEARERCVNIVRMAAETIAKGVKIPDGRPVNVVWTDVVVGGERDADVVARQFREACVDAVVVTPDTWAFPQPTLMSLFSHLPKDIPINITCGNNGSKPGMVYSHGVNGALAQGGRLTTLNVGDWLATGQKPRMTPETAEALIDWCYGALAAAGLKGRRVVIFGHDSMGIETCLAHVIPTRNTFGIEITRLDMKLLGDMLTGGAYDKKEVKALRAWFNRYVGDRIELRDEADDEKFDLSLAMYLIVRDIMDDLDAVGGGFQSQLEWGSDPRCVPMPVADPMESLFNATFDHRGRKAPVPYATESDAQGVLTMLVMTWLTGGNPPLFMDFRKVWEPWEIKLACEKLEVPCTGDEPWMEKGFVDGENSGSASLNWAAAPGASVSECMNGVSMGAAGRWYEFAGGGNNVRFVSPGGIEGIAARLSYSDLTGMFSLLWDEAYSVDLPPELAEVVCNASTYTWPHSFLVPKYATMKEYKQYAPTNHSHMTWNLPPARLEHWMDLTQVLSETPWAARDAWIDGVDRPLPLLYLLNGGENNAKLKLAGKA